MGGVTPLCFCHTWHRGLSLNDVAERVKVTRDGNQDLRILGSDESYNTAKEQWTS